MAGTGQPFGFTDDGAALDELAQRPISKPEESGVVYGKIQTRGIAQDVFRRASLRAYGRRCAFCGLSFEVALHVGHIIPWSTASVAQRLAPTNGLLLCSTHHSLFDSEILTVALDHRIICRRDHLHRHHWTDSDTRAAAALYGQRMSLPADPRLRPSVAALKYRADRLVG
jgi:putative restriction endonuclease